MSKKVDYLSMLKEDDEKDLCKEGKDILNDQITYYVDTMKETLRYCKECEYGYGLAELFEDYDFGMARYCQSFLKPIDLKEQVWKELVRLHKKIDNKSIEELEVLRENIRFIIKDEIDNLIDLPYYTFDVEESLTCIYRLQLKVCEIAQLIMLKEGKCVKTDFIFEKERREKASSK